MKIFLNAVNFLLIFFFAFIFIAFQTTFFHEILGNYKPNLLIILLSYLVLNRFSIEGGILAFLLGYITELHSGSPGGLYPVTFVLTFYGAKIISGGFLIHTMVSEVLFVGAITLLYKIFLMLVLAMQNMVHFSLLTSLLKMVPVACFNLLLAPVLFFLLKETDSIFGKERPIKTGAQESKIEFSS